MKKNFKLFSIVLACMAVGLMTSCLSDDNNNEDYEKRLKEWYETLQKEVTAMRGSYTGHVFYYDVVDGKTQLDSIAATWTVLNDSTLQLYNMPVGKLAPYVTDSTLKAALAAAGDVSVKVRISGYSTVTPVTFGVVPESAGFTAATGTQAEDWTLNFDSTSGNQYTYGAYSMATGEFGIQLYVRNVYAGSSLKAYFQNAPFIWRGKHL